ncbi:MAG TPA: hypothetical protein VIV83_09785 [Gemmatimonadales bacterium]|jgi:hypothetical protein
MDPRNTTPLAKPLWAYVYQLLPPQLADRLRTIQPLLDDQQVDARRTGRTWAGRVVPEERITHILVVSDSPDHNEGSNQKLESELGELKTEFSVSAPLPLT